MSFWQDASPTVKGVLAVGGLLIVYFAVAFVAGLPPYGSATSEPTTQERGLNPH